jgi:hypothetical protein
MVEMECLSACTLYITALPCLHVVINLQEQRHGFCRELDRARRHQQRLHNILFQDIRDLSLFTKHRRNVKSSTREGENEDAPYER